MVLPHLHVRTALEPAESQEADQIKISAHSLLTGANVFIQYFWPFHTDEVETAFFRYG